MLTRLIIRNFKRFDTVEVQLGNPVMFIGPNNSGKTSAMQAIALWDIGLKHWLEKQQASGAARRRKGVTINRRELLAVPIADAKLLWRRLHIREADNTRVQNVRIEITLEGTSNGGTWTCGMEFGYANKESLYCRPLRTDAAGKERMAVPAGLDQIRIGFLTPMSGLSSTETRIDAGAINVRIGEGRTAEVLRNLCFRIHEDDKERWAQLVTHIRQLFGVELCPPRYNNARGEIEMEYREDGITLDLSCTGRGLQQTLLLLAHIYSNPGAVLLLDEPDAHLEILRQRQNYRLIADVAQEHDSQIILASHSEVVLDEAKETDRVIAFTGKPHTVSNSSQLRKALMEIGFEHYLLAEQRGWVLYLEGAADLYILQAFAARLGHAAARPLERPFVHYVGNQPRAVQRHFHGLREAYPELRGIALFDRLEALPDIAPVSCLMWEKREIENYLCTERTLEEYAWNSANEDRQPTPPLHRSAAEEQKQQLQQEIPLHDDRQPTPPPHQTAAGERKQQLQQEIRSTREALEQLGKGSPWGPDLKVSDEFLEPLFERYFSALQQPQLLGKSTFHQLVQYVPDDELAPEVTAKLDAIAQIAESARPL